jgi:hypothetical protein
MEVWEIKRAKGRERMAFMVWRLLCYTLAMDPLIHKSIRRSLLLTLYERYMANPTEMLEPALFMGDGVIEKHPLLVNMHYLADRGLVELMLGYDPTTFSAVRITSKGIDLVENQFELDRQFPPHPDCAERDAADLPMLIEQLQHEADICDLDGTARRALLDDVAYLRNEIARPAACWRLQVIRSVLGWMSEAVASCDMPPPSLPVLVRRIEELTGI